jgi:hypothetical protein
VVKLLKAGNNGYVLTLLPESGCGEGGYVAAVYSDMASNSSVE